MALLAMGAVSCEGDKDNTKYIDIEFEGAQLGEASYLNNQSYVEKGVTFKNEYNELYSSWSGFAVSKKVDMTTPGYGNQYSVYATSGATGSTCFAVAYYSEFGDVRPTFFFAEGVEHRVVSAYFALTTYTYFAIKDGNDGFGATTAFSLANKDVYAVVATGFDKAGVKTGEITIKLADYTGTSPLLFDQWTKADLSELGRVNKITMKVTSTDVSAYGMNTPTYFAIDNIRFAE